MHFFISSLFDSGKRVVVHFSAMGMLRTLRKIGTTAVRAVSLLSVAFCLNGTANICFCDTDPDGCGEHCHDCSEPETEDSCKHLTIQIDEFLVLQTDTATVTDGLAIPDYTMVPQIAAIPSEPVIRPISTAPPDTGGTYVSYSTRIHLRS